VSRGALLLPNLGAEEGVNWRARLGEPAVRATARLWRLLFGARTSAIGLDEAELAWPEALGPAPEEPVFPWLERDGGLVPWLCAAEVLEEPALADHRLAAAAPAVVAKVHDKAFAHRAARDAGLVPGALADAIAVLEPAELEDPDAATEHLRRLLATWPEPWRQHFTLKPRFGTSGRGRVAGRAQALDDPALRGALPRLARRGGALLEPWLERRLDLSAQLWLPPEGDALLLGTAQQLVSRAGVARGHRGSVDSKGRITSDTRWDEPLREAAAAAAAAARDAGYWGPCGVDAFVFEDKGRLRLRPVVELNARFTLGTVALGLVRRALRRVKRPLALRPGVRRGFACLLNAPSGGWERAAAAMEEPRCAVALPGEPLRPGLLFAASCASLDGLRSAGSGACASPERT
jgi:hypothetical protein